MSIGIVLIGVMQMRPSVIAYKIRVLGHVQGVFFRATARGVALSANIVGYARNMADGSVELLAQGHLNDVEHLLKWAHHGPNSAKVDSVHFEEVPVDTTLMEFTTR